MARAHFHKAVKQKILLEKKYLFPKNKNEWGTGHNNVNLSVSVKQYFSLFSTFCAYRLLGTGPLLGWYDRQCMSKRQINEANDVESGSKPIIFLCNLWVYPDPDMGQVSGIRSKSQP